MISTSAPAEPQNAQCEPAAVAVDFGVRAGSGVGAGSGASGSGLPASAISASPVTHTGV